MTRAVAGVRVGMDEQGVLVLNPSVEQQEASSLDLMVAGTSEAVLMIEGYCDFMTEDRMLEVLS